MFENNRTFSPHVLEQTRCLTKRETHAICSLLVQFFPSPGSIEKGPMNVPFLAIGKKNKFPSVWCYSDKNPFRIREDICNDSLSQAWASLGGNLNSNSQAHDSV